MENSADEDGIANLKNRINSSNSSLTFGAGKFGIGKSTTLPLRLVGGDGYEAVEEDEEEDTRLAQTLLISLPT
jgi:hypothetical protein